MPPTSQLDWLSSTTAMIVLVRARATRDLLKSFGWGITALHRLDAATKLPFPRRPPHRICRSLSCEVGVSGEAGISALEFQVGTAFYGKQTENYGSFIVGK